MKRYYLAIFESIYVIVTFHSIQLLLESLIFVRNRHYWKLKKLSLALGYVSDNSTYSFPSFYFQKWLIVAPIRIQAARDADLEQVCILKSLSSKIRTVD